MNNLQFHCKQGTKDTVFFRPLVSGGLDVAIEEDGRTNLVTVKLEDIRTLHKELGAHLEKHKLTAEQRKLASMIVACATVGHENKISMIKMLREQTGLGLKEAKEAIEEAVRNRRPAHGIFR